MEEYIRFMNRKNRITAAKLLGACTLIFALCGAIAYSNTRYNGFADVFPAAYYYAAVGRFLQRAVDALGAFKGRFLHFFG